MMKTPKCWKAKASAPGLIGRGQTYSFRAPTVGFPCGLDAELAQIEIGHDHSGDEPTRSGGNGTLSTSEAEPRFAITAVRSPIWPQSNRAAEPRPMRIARFVAAEPIVLVDCKPLSKKDSQKPLITAPTFSAQNHRSSLNASHFYSKLHFQPFTLSLSAFPPGCSVPKRVSCEHHNRKHY